MLLRRSPEARSTRTPTCNSSTKSATTARPTHTKEFQIGIAQSRQPATIDLGLTGSVPAACESALAHLGRYGVAWPAHHVFLDATDISIVSESRRVEAVLVRVYAAGVCGRCRSGEGSRDDQRPGRSLDS